MENLAFFRTPQSIIYGRNALDQAGAAAGLLGRKALIVSDKVMEGLGYLRKISRLLDSADIKHCCYLGVESEPNDQYVAEALSFFCRNSVTF